MKLGILLTATITPNAAFVQRASPAIREDDYAKSLAKWLETRGADCLVFCENSGADLSRLKELASQSRAFSGVVELLSYRIPPFEPGLGKGWGEMDIVSYALGTSRQLASCDLLMKVTGRLFVRNASAIVSALGVSSDIEIHCDLQKNLTFADSRLFAATPRFLTKELLVRRGEVNDAKGIYFEHVLARCAHSTMASGYRWAPLNRAPQFEGIAGTSNVEISSGVFRSLRRQLLHSVKRAVLAR